jgi:acetoin utilization protein AcuB
MDMKVEEFTSLSLITTEMKATLGDALALMKKHQIRHLPVMDKAQVVGIVSERDLMANYGKAWSEHLQVKDIMNTDILFARANDDLGEVAFRLSKEKKGSAIVLDDGGEVYGIFTTTDALNALVEMLSPDAKGSGAFRDQSPENEN